MKQVFKVTYIGDIAAACMAQEENGDLFGTEEVQRTFAQDSADEERPVDLTMQENRLQSQQVGPSTGGSQQVDLICARMEGASRFAPWDNKRLS